MRGYLESNPKRLREPLKTKRYRRQPIPRMRIPKREEFEAEQLHVVRSPGCMPDRDRLSMMAKKDARTRDDLAMTHKRVRAQCPDVDLTGVWLIEWIPIPVFPQWVK
jgi:hypothetical protein